MIGHLHMACGSHPVFLCYSTLHGTRPITVQPHHVIENVGTLHTHDFFEFVLVHRGLLMHIVNGIGTVLVPGDLLCLAPGDTHVYHKPKNALIYNCMFKPEAIATDVAALAELPLVGGVLLSNAERVSLKTHLPPTRAQSVHELMQRLMSELSEDTPESRMASRGLLLQFLAETSRGFAANRASVTLPLSAYTHKFAGIAETINERLDDELRVCDLAEQAGLSEGHFCRLFRQFFGLTPLSYIHHLRISRAMALLATTPHSINSLALRCGFLDANYFARVFKNVAGMSPTEYRARASGGFNAAFGAAGPGGAGRP